MTHLDDQMNAATADLAGRVAGTLGGREIRLDTLPPRLAALLARRVTPDMPRCEHLTATPVQPAYLSLGVGSMRCGSCVVSSVEPVCDGCGLRYTGKHVRALTELLLRSHYLLISVLLCPICRMLLSSFSVPGERTTP